MGWGKEKHSPAVLPALLCLHGRLDTLLGLLRAGDTHLRLALGASFEAAGPLPAGAGLVQLPLRESRLLDALEPSANSNPVTTSSTLCVASEQPAGCNYRLRVFRAVAADQHYSRLTHKGQGILFFFFSSAVFRA